MNDMSIKPVAAILGTAFLTGVAAGAAADTGANPFVAEELTGGYDQYVPMAEGKCGGDKAAGEGTCGEGDKATHEGKCGEGDKAAHEGKCGEGKCGGDKAAGEGKCGEGKSGGDKAAGEGKCGEGKCGGDKAAGEGKCGG